MRRLLSILLFILLFIAAAPVYAQQAQTPAKLEVSEQALGWWLGGSGVVSMLAGGFTLAIAGVDQGEHTRDLQVAGGASLAGVGALLLAAGIYVMSSAAPGPCETSGTAIDGGVSVGVSPFGISLSGHF